MADTDGRNGHVSLDVDMAEDSDSGGEESPQSLQKWANESQGAQTRKTSCELCKARKVKCDKVDPACSWCSRHNRKCVYLERQRPAIKAKQVVELEGKVKELEVLLHALGRRVEEHIEADHGNQSHRPDYLQVSPTIRSLQLPTSDGDSFAYMSAGGTQHLVHDRPQEGNGETSSFGLSTPSTTWLPTCRTADSDTALSGAGQLPNIGDANNFQLPSSISIPSLLQASTSRNSPALGKETNGANGPGQVSHSLTARAELPPHDVLYMLVDLYFKHVNTWCPILDRKTTFATLFGSTSLAESDRHSVHAIVAVALRFSTDERLSAEAKHHFHETSAKKVMEYAMSNVSVDALKATVILYLDELGSSNGPRGRILLALMAQNVSQLGLGYERNIYLHLGEHESDTETDFSFPTSRALVQRPESWIEDEGRRRLFWAAYMLDRYSAIAANSSSFLIRDESANRFLPCSYDLFSKNYPVETRAPWHRDRHRPTAGRPDNLGSFSYHCDILRIMSHIHEFLDSPPDAASPDAMQAWHSTYQSLDRALDDWLQSLPSEYGKISGLCHSDPASRVANWFMLHSAFVTAVLRLHAVAAYSMPMLVCIVEGTAPAPSHYAVQRCLSAVRSLADIARDILDADGLNLLGPPFTLSLWVAARVLIVHAAAFGADVGPTVDFFIDTLRTMGQYWQAAGKYAEILSRVVRQCRIGAVSFEAMRKRAQNLMELTSSVPRSGAEGTATQPVTPIDQDYICVFGLFGFPGNL